MALQSQLFRGDTKLEAAAVSDPAHILQGAAGEHVRKIQQALIQLDGAALDPDGKYGPATATAVSAFKQKRQILNTQGKIDNIVGKKTMAALDREQSARESVPAGPLQIRPINPLPRVGPPILRLGFKIDLDFPVPPDGKLLKIRLTPKSTGILEILNGAGGRVRCTNGQGGSQKTCFIFDPKEDSLVPATRLNPVRRGPFSRIPLSDGGTVRVTDDLFTIHIDAFHPGDAFVDASTARSATVLTIEVRAPIPAPVPGFAPPKKTRPGSKFISADDSEPGPKGARTDNGGRPVNPKGTGRKINLFGSQETPGFDDYTSQLQFTTFGSDANIGFRAFTEDTDPAVRIQDRTASDICMRDSPLSANAIALIRRIASPGCRLTFGSSSEGMKQFGPILKTAFPGLKVLPGEEFSDAIAVELP